MHFLPSVDPAALGHKALAVNLSDLAACGAEPRCFFLALALPQVDEAWLAAFSGGMFALADAHRCVLAGGDTTRSPQGVVITVTVMGSVPRGQALLRSGARPGDEIWVSGTLGDAALGLALRQGGAPVPADARAAVERLERPQPQVGLGLALRGVATAAIDVSDGLLGDLGHILERSAVGARVEWSRIPRSGRAAPPGGGGPAPLRPCGWGRLRTAVHRAGRPARRGGAGGGRRRGGRDAHRRGHFDRAS